MPKVKAPRNALFHSIIASCRDNFNITYMTKYVIDAMDVRRMAFFI